MGASTIRIRAHCGFYGAHRLSQNTARRYVIADLCASIERAKGEKVERVFHDIERIKKLLDRAKDQADGVAYRAMHLAAFAGLRRGEAAHCSGGTSTSTVARFSSIAPFHPVA